MKYKNLIFDLDGTLIDPLDGVYQSLQDAFQSLDAKLPKRETLNWIVGPPIKESIRNILSEQNLSDLSDSVHRAFRKSYDQGGYKKFQAYEGAHELIKNLAQKYKLYIASSKPEPGPQKIMEIMELSSCFEAIHGANLENNIKTKTDVLNFLFAESGIEKEESVMIGDRYHDLEGAMDLSIDAIGVLWGYGKKEELVALPHIALCSSLEDLKKILVS